MSTREEENLGDDPNCRKHCPHREIEDCICSLCGENVHPVSRVFKESDQKEFDMNDKIKDLLAQIDKNKEESDVIVSRLREILQAEYNSLFYLDRDLAMDIADFEKSKNYGTGSYGLYRWHRLKNYTLPTNESDREGLVSYLAELGYALDVENRCLIEPQGETIQICDESGDVYLADPDGDAVEWICRGVDYGYTCCGGLDREKRNGLIIAWQEKTGFWPGVFRVTRDGSAVLVDVLRNIKQAG